MIQLTPKKFLNKAFLKLRINRNDLDKFTTNLTKLLTNINENESEEFQKNLLTNFLNNTYYQPNYFLNTKGRNDLVIHNGKDAKSTVGVILELKKPANKFVRVNGRSSLHNQKVLQELLLYYLRERITANNLEIKYLIVTNVYEWFIFDAQIFDKLFAQNKQLVKQFIDFENGILAIKTTDLFYQEIAKKAISSVENELTFTYFDLREFAPLNNEFDPPQPPLSRGDSSSYPPYQGGIKGGLEDLITLYKIFSPEHLLKLPFLNETNSLDKNFYHELLYIIGLTEVKQGSKKLIQREKLANRNKGSLLENAITQINSLGKIHHLENAGEYGETEEEQLFNLSLELVITWVNRILFLKLLESQLINYNCRDVIYNVSTYSFLNLDKIKNYGELNSLFFQVLAVKNNDRDDDIKEKFAYIPYLNSSLFEISDIENKTIVISNLSEEKIPLFSATILKDRNGKKRTGNINSLSYLFDFLNSYYFGETFQPPLNPPPLKGGLGGVNPLPPQPPLIRGESSYPPFQGGIKGGSEILKEDNKTLINAAVLGLIFEKINGYQDGSFFTPSFITMYMCRETMNRAILQKFNEIKGWNCENLSQLYDRITDKKEANSIINSITICDPAVGSGHFLVSALNEIIAIKSELKILLDKEGKTLRDYDIEVVNDELIITDDDGNLFEYNPQSKESQRIQETLFHEKQTIIENCLFGVDINPNSVKICRLRLWIELLKNAYYNVILSDSEESQHWRDASLRQHDKRELQTLPNIDINIKCGNSLISKFQLDLDLKKVLKQSQSNITSYKNAVKNYKNATNKQEKRELVKLINNLKWTFRDTLVESNPKKTKLRKLAGELYNLENQISLFEETKTEKKAREKQVNKLNNEIDKLTIEIEEIETGIIYQKAFEWRFEFPEVLDDEGNFIGFDVIIGNPPYLPLESFNQAQRNLFRNKYNQFTRKFETSVLFIVEGLNLTQKRGLLSYIAPVTWQTGENYAEFRKFLITEKGIEIIINLPFNTFEDAYVDTAIYLLNNQVNNAYKIYNFPKKDQRKDLTKLDFDQIDLSSIVAPDFKIILEKNLQKFMLNFNKNKYILLGEITKSTQGLSGSNFPPAPINNNYQELYPFLAKGNVYNYTLLKDEIYQTDLTGKKSLIQFYQAEPKLLIRRIINRQDRLSVGYCEEKMVFKKDINPFICIDKNFDPKFLLGIIASKFVSYLYLKMSSIATKDDFRQTTLSELRKLPIPVTTIENQNSIIFFVNQILSLKKSNPNTNTNELEREIDLLVYELYGLTEEEIAIIENNLPP